MAVISIELGGLECIGHTFDLELLLNRAAPALTKVVCWRRLFQTCPLHDVVIGWTPSTLPKVSCDVRSHLASSHDHALVVQANLYRKECNGVRDLTQPRRTAAGRAKVLYEEQRRSPNAGVTADTIERNKIDNDMAFKYNLTFCH